MDKALLAVFEAKGYQVEIANDIAPDEPLTAHHITLRLKKGEDMGIFTVPPDISLASMEEAATWADEQMQRNIALAKEQA